MWQYLVRVPVGGSVWRDGSRAASRMPTNPPKTLGNPCGIPKVPCHVACSALIIVNATEVWHHCDAVCAFVSVVTLEALAVGALKVDAAYF